MKGSKAIEGEIFKVSGHEPEYGDSIRVVVAETAMDFKEEIVIMGEGGFKAYPSEEFFLELSEMLKEYSYLKGTITEIKKEGIYNALFRVD